MKIDDNFYFLYGIYGCNVGIIISEGEIALVDSGWTDESVDLILSYIDTVRRPKSNLQYVFLTHGHHDHIGGLHRLQKEFDTQIVVHKAEVDHIENPREPIRPSKANIVFNKDTTFKVGDLELQFILTPGHSPGSTCIYNKERSLLFTGDVVTSDRYHPGVGWWIRAPLILGEVKTYINSLNRLLNLKLKWVLPGHGVPIRGGKKRIEEYIQVAEGLKETAYNLLRKEELCASELAKKLNVHPPLAKKMIDELKEEGRVEQTVVKVLKEEPCFKSK